MEVFKIFLLFILPINILLLIFIKTKIKRLDLIFFALGAGPFFNALILYYLIWFFPEKPNYFYLLIIYLIQFIFILSYFKNFNLLINLYKRIYKFFKIQFLKLHYKLLVLIPCLIIFILIVVQSLYLPVAEHDKAVYLNQIQAIYETKNQNWRIEDYVIIRGNDQHHYNSAVRPGIPYLMVFSLMHGGMGEDHLVFKFLPFYYYILLYLVLIYIVYLYLKKQKKLKNFKYSIFYLSFFYFFTWFLAKNIIFNHKESIIYTLGFLSLIFGYKVIN